jgi:hypothetical protein
MTVFANIERHIFMDRVAHAANIKLSEIFKKRALVVHQSFMLLIKCVQVHLFTTEKTEEIFYILLQKIARTVVHSIPPFLKLRRALMRYAKPVSCRKNGSANSNS